MKTFSLQLLDECSIMFKMDIILGEGGDNMRISDVRVRKINSEGKMKAIVSVTFDDCFVVHDIKIIEGQEGLFIAMPSRKMPDGEFKDIAHPINSETRNIVAEAVFKAYEEKRLEESENVEEAALL